MMDMMAKNQPKPAPNKDGKPAQAAPAPGFGPKDPKVVAEQLKVSLQGLKESADFLNKSDFVK